MSCFAFLKNEWPLLATLGELAELKAYGAPKDSLMASGEFAKTILRLMCAFEGVNDENGNADRSTQMLAWKGAIPDSMRGMFDAVRSCARHAESLGRADTTSAATSVRFCWRLGGWCGRAYGEKTSGSETAEPLVLTDIDYTRLRRIESEAKILESCFPSYLQSIRQEKVPSTIQKARRETGMRVAKKMVLTEEETRAMIDTQLRAAGWDADTQFVRYSKGERPQKGINKAIAEWPTSSGPADYALFCGLELIGFVEAKKKARDVLSDLAQAKRYSQDAEIKGSERMLNGSWGQFKVPFLFSTNGRPFIAQHEAKSGVWFLDCRKETNHPRPLHAWYSPEGLRGLLDYEPEKSYAKLTGEPLDYLGLRDYQEKAITSVENAIASGKNAILVAMATGTGKTRTAIGLIYRLIKTGRFHRVLFLVDRNPLGVQAGDSFKEYRLEDLQTFDKIYDFKEIGDRTVDPDTKVHIATVQGVLWRMMLSTGEEGSVTVDQYDCIIVDEAHRGYTLDKEMDEHELAFRSEKEYLSRYKQVLDFFDAVKIGLTATPAPHTTQIFGHAVFTYSYREAVIEGWLCDHDPPHIIETHLKKQGIVWKKGETIPVYDTVTGEITNIEDIPDEVSLPVDQFNKAVLTENFNRTVCRELAKHLSPDGDEKTLVYAVTDDHADLVVQLFKEAFEEAGCPVIDDAIMKITGSVDKVDQKIRRYKNEKYPNIAVTVDLLTTGIDVHAICNLVFIRRVKSRILYEQMLGRATRRCDRIGKDHFSIFDCVGLYEVLEPVTNIKPIVKDPNVSLLTLIEELRDLDTPEQQRLHVDQILAKLQRKAASLGQGNLADFEERSGMSLASLIRKLRHATTTEAARELGEKKKAIAYLDENRNQSPRQFMSTHADHLESHTRGYGKGEKPEDYLNEFRQFILDNMNRIPALAIVCQRPRSLTRKALKELKMALDERNFTEPALRTAWREWKNEDIAADIISFVRRLALGDALISHEDRIKNAMKKIYTMQDWNKTQREWLARMERHLLAESLIEKQDFNEGAFRDHGGFDRLDKIFQGRLTDVMQTINNYLYPEERKYA